MSSLMEEINAKAVALGVPLSAHVDLTWRCNERCVHCYLDHDDRGEMDFEEVARVLSEMAEAGVLLLTLSGGEPLLRKDFFAIVRRARQLAFNVKVKTNAILIREQEAALMRRLGVETVQVSLYSHRPEIHDAITMVKGSLARSLAAVSFLAARGLKVTIAHVLMRQNRGDYPGVQEMAAQLGARFTIDPTITPHINGDRSILALNAAREDLRKVLHDPALVGDVEKFCAPPAVAGDEVLEGAPCSAGHSACYVSPYGDFYPCVQFPLPCGNVRRRSFAEIWKTSPQLKEVRSINARDLPVCSQCPLVGACSRCPGLAYMEGDMRGPSSADCEKSYLRTGIPSANVRLEAQLANAVPLGARRAPAQDAPVITARTDSARPPP